MKYHECSGMSDSSFTEIIIFTPLMYVFMRGGDSRVAGGKVALLE